MHSTGAVDARMAKTSRAMFAGFGKSVSFLSQYTKRYNYISSLFILALM